MLVEGIQNIINEAAERYVKNIRAELSRQGHIDQGDLYDSIQIVASANADRDVRVRVEMLDYGRMINRGANEGGEDGETLNLPGDRDLIPNSRLLNWFIRKKQEQGVGGEEGVRQATLWMLRTLKIWKKSGKFMTPNSRRNFGSRRLFFIDIVAGKQRQTIARFIDRRLIKLLDKYITSELDPKSLGL